MGKLVEAYYEPEDHPDIARLVDLDEVKDNLFNLSIPLYIAVGKEEGKMQDSAPIRTKAAI